MKPIHNTRNCNYRRFLHKKLKHGKISGKFYKFIYRNFPIELPQEKCKFVFKKFFMVT